MKTLISALIIKAALLLMIIAASVVMPFKVDAATWGDAPIIGINIYAIDYDYNQVPLQTVVSLDTNQTRWHCASSHSSMGCQTWVSENTDGNTTSSITGRLNTQSYHDVTATLFKYEVVFDKSYVGRIHINWGSSSTSTYFTRYLYVNGTSVEFTTNILYESFSIDSYQLEYAPEEVINAGKQFNIPIESYLGVFPFLNRQFNIVSFSDLYDSQYPIFLIEANTNLISAWANIWSFKEFYFIFWSSYDIWDINSFNNNFTVTNGECTEVVRIGQVQMISDGNVSAGNTNIVKVKITNTTNDSTYIVIANKGKCEIMPIYFNTIGNKYISTDFALRYGLTNQLLDDLHIIANGTSASNQQSQDLSSGTDSMQQQMNNLVGVEDSYNQQFNNSVNSIDFTNPLQQNAGLLGASNFVISVFNGLIANNPFSILIIIVCILLIGKKVIGK